MSGIAQLEDLYSGVEESAGLLGVAASRDKIWPILTAYEDAIPQALIAFRVVTHARHEGEFDFFFSLCPLAVGAQSAGRCGCPLSDRMACLSLPFGGAAPLAQASGMPYGTALESLNCTVSQGLWPLQGVWFGIDRPLCCFWVAVAGLYFC